MSKPGSKYFKGRIYQGKRVLHYIIWDGVRDYRNEPPLKIIAAQFEGTALHVKVDAQAIEDIDDLHALLAAPLDGCPDCGALVMWARDHRTYRRIVQHLTDPDRIWLT